MIRRPPRSTQSRSSAASDVYKRQLENEGITNSIKEGFLFTLLSSARSMHDILFPNKIDQRATFENQFKGMTLKSFTYSDFELTSDRLLTSLHVSLTHIAAQMLKI